MATFLLTWNPSRTALDVPNFVARLRSGKVVKCDWSVGGRVTGIGPGDQFFMLRQGVEPRGIMGSGRIVSEVWEGEHWSGEGTANYVDIEIDVVVDPDEEPDRMIPIAELTERFEGRFYFKRVQSSGQKLPDDVAAELEEMWAERVGEHQFDRLPQEVVDYELYTEGAVRTITVNASERSRDARRACIEHWGTRCSVCEFDFGAIYGELGEGYIEVHHLVPMADLDDEYVVDPVKDLRPVCPNCHAMIHRGEHPLTIKELQELVRSNRAQPAP